MTDEVMRAPGFWRVPAAVRRPRADDRGARGPRRPSAKKVFRTIDGFPWNLSCDVSRVVVMEPPAAFSAASVYALILDRLLAALFAAGMIPREPGSNPRARKRAGRRVGPVICSAGYGEVSTERNNNESSLLLSFKKEGSSFLKKRSKRLFILAGPALVSMFQAPQIPSFDEPLPLIPSRKGMGDTTRFARLALFSQAV